MATDEARKACRRATVQFLGATVSGDAETYAGLVSDDLDDIHSTGEQTTRALSSKVGAGQYTAVAKIEYAPTDIWVIGEVLCVRFGRSSILKMKDFPARPSVIGLLAALDDRWSYLVHHFYLRFRKQSA